MSKRFFEVFPTLKLNSEISKKLEAATVESLSVHKNTGIISIEIDNKDVIEEDILKEASDAVFAEVFFERDLKVSIKQKDRKQEEMLSEIIERYENPVSEEKPEATEQKTMVKDISSMKNPYRKKIEKIDGLFYGRNFDMSVITPISELFEGSGLVVIKGQVFDIETRELKNEKMFVNIAITDFSDSIMVKLFIPADQMEPLNENISNGSYLAINGVPSLDNYSGELVLSGIRGMAVIDPIKKDEMDTCEEKRVELHAHTLMSEMDSVVDPKALVKLAAKWGHPAVAITDHGVVQSFPDANKAKKDLKKAGKDIKVLYGVEGYLVDDLKPMIFNCKDQTLNDSFVVFDIETTGFSKVHDAIIEIGAVKIIDGEIVDRFSTFVDPKRPIPEEITKLTTITDADVKAAEPIEVVLPQFMEFCKDSVLVAHNASFDTGFIRENAARLNIPYDFTAIDTVGFARTYIENIKNYKLDTVCEYFGIDLKNHHRAVDDANATALMFLKLCELAKEEGTEALKDLNSRTSMSAAAIKKAKTYHVVILAKNDVGRVNLYKLVSISHLDYFANKAPRIPKSVLEKYREGLIVGSACQAGELYRALLDDASEEDLEAIVSYYDYLEIQPRGNNDFMVDSEKYRNINSIEDVLNINKKIVALGEKYNKPVCATGDVHYLKPDDDIYRRVIKVSKGYDDEEREPSLYFRTTQNMLDEFAYLGEEKAREVVITNTHIVADMIEDISPISPDKCPPVIENSDETLRELCEKRAHEIYGEKLPEIVEKRMERELNSIISNGYAVMYIIAQKLVQKSISDGYLVGSRGSVGSSFAAYLSGITEVNSLSAHYICPECYYVDFDSDYVKSFSGKSGCDMEDRNCPVCGHKLKKDGHDIPFETFLGFKGNKEPDIDLNFSGEYQPVAHAYTEEIFGKGHTFRAGTIGGVAEKTAFGYTKGFYESKNEKKRSCEIARIAKGCEGVKKTTGQHPGGIVVLPHGMDINTFTPVQHPANDVNTPIITTHFDYHSIDQNLLKLDILGHDDPTMIRMLQDITGVDPQTIPLDDKKVMSLFLNTEALGIKPEDISGTDKGTLGVPEFGTDFVIGMLRDTKPTEFSSLVRISGLSHGTDVWLNNAQDLIREGKTTISNAVCTRDDIMVYLINKGLESEQSFKIMESVRKGKGLTPEWEEEMTAHGVPDWYIGSCKKIKYMFPKAHAVAYVTMGFRIAWYKVYYPLAYYAAYFSIRATDISYETMCQGKDILRDNMAKYRANPAPSKKEDESYKVMRMVEEMLARGFEFLPIDIYRSHATKFQIVDGKLLPPFSSIDGMGDIAAQSLYEAAKEGRFMSRDEIKTRGKVSQTIVDKMFELGILGDMPKSNQISLFDLGL